MQRLLVLLGTLSRRLSIEEGYLWIPSKVSRPCAQQGSLRQLLNRTLSKGTHTQELMMLKKGN